MPSRSFKIDDIGEVTVYKRRKARNIRISLTHEGSVRVSMPYWLPYKMGLEFVSKRKSWVITNRHPLNVFFPEMRIGKAHVLVFKPANSQKIRTRVHNNTVVVSQPRHLHYSDNQIQGAVTTAAIRALKTEANQLLPKRIEYLAKTNGYTYNSIKIKQLKSRWGSCNQNKDIVLNCYLMQLPWQLIDYVILHELAHTKILAHGPDFWTELSKHVKDLKQIKKIIRSYRPHLTPA